MTIYIDNQQYHLADGATVADALALVENLPNGGFAVANGSTVVPRDTWHSTPLEEGAKLKIFKAFFGG